MLYSTPSMRVAAPLTLAILLSITGAGCGSDPPPPSAATTCGLSSDCTAGLQCSFGHCVPKCAKDSDCADGVRCLVSNEGAACVDPKAAACGPTRACPNGTTCASDATCRTICSGLMALSCVEGQVCSGTSCVGTDPGHDPGLGGHGGAGGGGAAGHSGGGASGQGGSGQAGSSAQGGAGTGGHGGAGTSGQGGAGTGGQGGGGQAGGAGKGGTSAGGGGSGGGTGGAGGSGGQGGTPNVCSPNSKMCSDPTSFVTCAADGSGYGASMSCTGSELCSGGVCGNTVVRGGILATPSASAGNIVLRGGGFVARGSCDAANQICVTGGIKP